jgi:hypothetical protein
VNATPRGLIDAPRFRDWEELDMLGTVVMLMALSGLGCHNKNCDVAHSTPVSTGFTAACTANVDSSHVGPSCDSLSHASRYRGGHSPGYPGGALRATVQSFVLGHDADVRSAREIEESLYSGRYAQSLVYPAATPPARN